MHRRRHNFPWEKKGAGPLTEEIMSSATCQELAKRVLLAWPGLAQHRCCAGVVHVLCRCRAGAVLMLCWCCAGVPVLEFRRVDLSMETFMRKGQKVPVDVPSRSIHRSAWRRLELSCKWWTRVAFV